MGLGEDECEVDGFATQVLRRADASHHPVDGLAAVAAGDAEGYAEVSPCGLHALCEQVLQLDDVTGPGDVGQFLTTCGFRVAQLAEREVLRQLDV